MENYYINYNVWNEVTYPFPNFNRAAFEVWEMEKKFHPKPR